MSQLKLDGSVQVSELVERLFRAETEANELRSKFSQLEARVLQLEGGKPSAAAAAAPAKPAPTPAAAPAKPKNDDDFDLFEDEPEEDSEEKKRITEERLKAYNAKKTNSNYINISLLLLLVYFN
jgi:uncharacterized membrane protein